MVINKYLEYVILVLELMIFVKYILHEKIKSNKVNAMVIVILMPLYGILMVNGYLYIKTMVLFLLLSFLIVIIFKIEIDRSLLYTAIYMIIYIISKVMVYLITMAIFNNYIINNTLVFIIMLFILYNFRDMICKVLKTQISNQLTFYIVLLLMVILFFYYLTFNNVSSEIGLLSSVCIISIVVVMLFTFLLQVYQNNQLVEEYDKLLEFIKKYEIEIDKQRTMRHEVKNQLLTIKSKIIDKDNSNNIIDYVDKILDDNKKNINHSLYAKLNYLPANGIKGLCYFKISEAMDKNIDVDINITNNLDDSILAKMDADMFNEVGKLLGIFLDNAIEAANEAIKKQIGIEIYLVKKDVNIIIANTYEKIVSNTKGPFRGHGLSLAKNIIASNKLFELKTEITDELYIQKLIIKGDFR